MKYKDANKITLIRSDGWWKKTWKILCPPQTSTENHIQDTIAIAAWTRWWDYSQKPAKIENPSEHLNWQSGKRASWECARPGTFNARTGGQRAEAHNMGDFKCFFRNAPSQVARPFEPGDFPILFRSVSGIKRRRRG